MKRPTQPITPLAAANQADGGLELFGRQFGHYQAFEALESTRLNNEELVNWADEWEKQVIARSYHPALIDASTKTHYSYLALDRLADTVAHWALNSRCPDRVALYQVSPVVLIAMALGLAKVGKHAMFFHQEERPEQVLKVSKRQGIKLLIGPDIPGLACIRAESIIHNTWPGPVAKVYRQHVKAEDPALIIFTSGFRGDSKPILLSHQRIIKSMTTWGHRININPTDRCYLPVELTHGEAFIAGLGACFSRGATAVIPGTDILDESPQTWMQQVKDNHCTMLQYTGQFWRSVVTERPQPGDEECPLVAIFGTGLDADLHKTVTKRYGINRVVEYYWASDMADAPLFNWTNRPGFCAFIPPQSAIAEDVALVGRDGKQAGFNEPGELLVRVKGKRYRRYMDSKSYGNNILTNVFAKGDRWWRSGDIMKRNANGFFTFVKRANEEFTWQGQTVCPTRVAQVFHDIGWFREVALYQVDVPHQKEKAIMASLVPFKPIYELDMEELLMLLQAMLPAASIPAFLRISDKPHPKTGNFKIPTAKLADKGFFYIEETDHFVLENGEYQLIDLAKLRQFDENTVQIGIEAYPEFGGIPTLNEAV